MSAIATYLTQSGQRRLFRCHACATSFSETRDTVFFDLRTSEEKVIFALKMLLVRVDLSGISFVRGVTEETVREWLRRAALKAAQIHTRLLRDLPVTPIQLDEMGHCIARTHTRDISTTGESLSEEEDGRQWVPTTSTPPNLPLQPVETARQRFQASVVHSMLLSRVAKQGRWGKVLPYPLHDYERLDPYRPGVTASRRARPVASTGQQTTVQGPGACGWLCWFGHSVVHLDSTETGPSLHPCVRKLYTVRREI